MNTLEMKNDMALTPVGELAVTNPGGVAVFNKYHIDYCCGGKLSLYEACENAGVKPEVVIDELRTVAGSPAPGTFRFDTWDASLLIEFIIQHHHQYVKRSIPLLRELLAKVYEVHGDNHPELKAVQENFEKISQELQDHMKKEELVLFPAIRSMIGSQQDNSFSMDIEEPMRMMEDEHELVGNLIKSVRVLTQNYTPPASACPTYRLTFARMKEFDEDLMQHIHLENNVLFEKVRNY